MITTASALGGAESSPFLVDLPEFNGPLDLLLSLIRDERVDIYDIPIARVAQQFLARVHDLGLNEAAEYLEMAARLLRIKAQMLLPRPGGEEAWEDPRAELVRRLLEYQQMREVVDVLERRGEERRNRFARALAPGMIEVAVPDGPLSLHLVDLLAAVDRVLRVTKEPSIHEVVPRALDVAGAIVAIKAVLALRQQLGWSDLVRLDAEPWEKLSVFLALLEMAKLGELRLRQAGPFGRMEINRDAVSEAA
ncbi:MAG: segregation/condensation protein A [Gemmatimonadaceae bacterium]|jgi:segregation and condensation protein A|nr:segregation/condensation protein A [Gemmatimonadaceae bacterium]